MTLFWPDFPRDATFLDHTSSAAFAHPDHERSQPYDSVRSTGCTLSEDRDLSGFIVSDSSVIPFYSVPTDNKPTTKPTRPI